MFKTLTGVLDKRKNPSDDEINKIPSYVFCRWLSGNPHSISAGNQINIYHKIPMVNQYRMIKSAFAGKIKYIPYPKNISESALKQEEYVAEHFKINISKAKEYISLMSKQELKEIVDLYSRSN